MAGIPFKSEVRNVGELVQMAPRGLMPFVDMDGERIGDTSHIIERLKRVHNDPLNDARLSRRQNALGDLVKSLCEFELYYYYPYGRWQEGDTESFARHLLRHLPDNEMAEAIEQTTASARNMLHIGRVGRYEPEHIIENLRSRMDTLAYFLGDKPYFFDDKPSTIDAGLYGFLAQFIHFPLPNPHAVAAREFSTLVDYCDRIKAQFYPASEWIEGPDRRTAVKLAFSGE